MVNPKLFRTHTSRSTSEENNTKQAPAVKEEEDLFGMIVSLFTPEQIQPSESKSGITIPLRMIWLDRECITS
jgi:hypothetical protein